LRNAGTWRVAAASVCGSGHERAGLPCQDAHQWATVAERLLVVAVADGAGSAPMSADGAAIAVASATEALREELASSADVLKLPDEGLESILKNALAMAKSALESEANKRSLPVSALATTLVLVLAGPGLAAAAQVGDGSVVGVTAEGGIISLLRPTWSEYLNETVFVTSDDGLACSKAAVCRQELKRLAVMSDGLQMAALRMPEGEPYPGFFTPLFEFLEQEPDPAAARDGLTEFLSSPRLRERTDDDVTLVLATRAP
jgi:hypothetical protein